MLQTDGPQFGALVPGIEYIDRPGVYALAIRDGQLLVVETAAGYFLPGGAIDDGESPDDALRRELLEETGFSVDGPVELGTARQYVIDSSTGAGYNKIETFYSVTRMLLHAQLTERDHIAHWVSICAALAGLREPAQVWAVRQLSLSSPAASLGTTGTTDSAGSAASVDRYLLACRGR